MKELQVAEIVRVLVLSWKHEYFKHKLNLFSNVELKYHLVQLKLQLIFFHKGAYSSFFKSSSMFKTIYFHHTILRKIGLCLDLVWIWMYQCRGHK